MKISFDFGDENVHKERFGEEVNRIILGCADTVKKLKKFGNAITEFQICFRIFSPGSKSSYGPMIKVFFKDTIGRERSHETDYSFMTPNRTILPTSNEIARHLTSILLSRIKENIRWGKQTAIMAVKESNDLLGEK